LHDAVGNERSKAERPPGAGVEDLVIVPLGVIPLAISNCVSELGFPLTPSEGDFFDRRQLRFSHYFLYLGSNAGARRAT
jgi:hypothetical protein